MTDLPPAIEAAIEHVADTAGTSLSGSPWRSSAEVFLMQYLARIPDEHRFLAEDVRRAAEPVIGEPRDGRAWGAVFRGASINLFIIRDGYRAAKTSNHSPKPLWRKGPALVDLSRKADPQARPSRAAQTSGQESIDKNTKK